MRSGYIAGPVYDAVMFFGAPVLALVIGAAISGTALADQELTLWGHAGTATSIFIGSFIMAHLVLVVVRSHGNGQIFARHRGRFVVVPVVLWLLLYASDWALAIAVVLVVWWDVLHSSLQTFGLGRIYDARMGNPPEVGRRLDWGLNVLLYVGPIVAGATLLMHLSAFAAFERVGAVVFRRVPVYAEAQQGLWARGLVIAGAVYLLVYVLGYLRLARRGYLVSWQKLVLLVATGACSLVCWGFDSFGEAFFVMNFFHAWQYFGLVWWSERGNLQRRLRVGPAAALIAMIGAAFAYGVWAECVDGREQRAALGLTLVVSLMHFWWDGFIWSVRRREV